MLVDAEGFGDGGTGDIRVKHGGLISAALHLACKKAGNEAFANAALAADNGNDPFNACCRVELCAQILLLTIAAVFLAGRTIVCTFAHFEILLISNIVI